ncbi:sugar ABC transporter permease [Cohnella endophytica]|uniref:Sugar ABC transporter permease n=1 Tax=Cohnella endophytica TaxID=2419778 RepID=A0A494XN06_9BACL|nr:ABC transporter permease subunit [Cohnella endophytica]RKP48933.1 sugar ABC transporter permease [Cohnella endophytica]
MFLNRIKKELPLHLIILPGLALVVLFSYLPMAGIVIAFQDFVPAKGLFGAQKWVGGENFAYVTNMPGFYTILRNTIYIAFGKMLIGLLVPIAFAIMINEVKGKAFKRSVQTIIYLPHFLSWVILSGILIDILSPSSGIVNSIIKAFGFQPIYFLGDNSTFPLTMIFSDVWKEFGFGTVIYLATISTIDPQIYEASSIDGAGKWRQIWHVTLPGMRMIIVLVALLSLGNILNAGFDQIFNLYGPAVYESGDVIDTFVYRLGLLDAQFGPATAVGLLKSVVSTLFIGGAYYAAYRFANYRVF